MAQITLSGKVQTVYDGRRFTGSDGQPVDAITFDLCVSRDGAREEVSTANGDVKNKCDFYRCHIYGKKAVDFYRLTLNNPKRIVSITGNMLQEEKPCTNRPIHIGKDNALFPLLSQYVQVSNGAITTDATGDIWIKGDYLFDKAVKINVHTFNFLDYPGAQQGNGFGVEAPTSSPFGAPAQNNAFGTPNQNNAFGTPAQNNGFGASTAGTFGTPAQNNGFGGQAQSNGFGGQGGFPAQNNGFQSANPNAGFGGNTQAFGFPSTNNTNAVAPTNNGFQQAPTQAPQQNQAIAGFTAPTNPPAGFAQTTGQQAPVQAPTEQPAPVETNIPAPANTAMAFTPASEGTGDTKRPF